VQAETEHQSVTKGSIMFQEEEKQQASLAPEPVRVQTYQKGNTILDQFLTEEDYQESIQDVFNSNPDDFEWVQALYNKLKNFTAPKDDEFYLKILSNILCSQIEEIMFERSSIMGAKVYRNAFVIKINSVIEFDPVFKDIGTLHKRNTSQGQFSSNLLASTQSEFMSSK